MCMNRFCMGERGCVGMFTRQKGEVQTNCMVMKIMKRAAVEMRCVGAVCWHLWLMKRATLPLWVASMLMRTALLWDGSTTRAT